MCVHLTLDEQVVNVLDERRAPANVTFIVIVMVKSNADRLCIEILCVMNAKCRAARRQLILSAGFVG